MPDPEVGIELEGTSVKTVTSADGTPIAFEQRGSGPHLLLVHGTATIRAPWAPIFEDHFTVTSMDRRGRGDSGDGPVYSVEREFEDIAALVEALEAPVLLFGHSFGGLCALGAAMHTDKLAGLALYEPSIFVEGSGYPPEQIERLETLLAGGDHEGVVKAMYADFAGMPPHEIELLTASPAWPARVVTAHTIPRELRAENNYRLDTGRLARLSIPVLLLLGGESPPMASKTTAALEKVLPNARTVVMPGQQHIAMYTGPDLLARAVLEFWQGIA